MVTLGAEGVRVERKGEEPIVVPAVPEIEKVEPTGVGDAFRAGFLAALEWDLSLERAAQLGCLLAVYVVEKVGTQEYTLHQAAVRRPVRRGLRRRGAAAEIAAHVQDPPPLTPSPLVSRSRRTTNRGTPSSATSSPTYS